MPKSRRFRCQCSHCRWRYCGSWRCHMPIKMAGAVVVVAPCAAANRTQSLLSISSCFSFVFVAGTCRSGYALAMATLVAVVVRSTSLLRFIFIVPLLMMIYNLFTFCLLLLRAIVLRLFCDYTLSHTLFARFNSPLLCVSFTFDSIFMSRRFFHAHKFSSLHNYCHYSIVVFVAAACLSSVALPLPVLPFHVCECLCTLFDCSRWLTFAFVLNYFYLFHFIWLPQLVYVGLFLCLPLHTSAAAIVLILSPTSFTMMSCLLRMTCPQRLLGNLVFTADNHNR